MAYSCISTRDKRVDENLTANEKTEYVYVYNTP